MRGRKLRWVFAGLAVLLVAAGFVLWPRPDRVTRETYERIQPGMSRAEVEAILGPPGDYRTGPSVVSAWPGDHRLFDIWVGDERVILVRYNGPVVKYSDSEITFRETQGPLDSFLWRMKRLSRNRFPPDDPRDPENLMARQPRNGGAP